MVQSKIINAAIKKWQCIYLSNLLHSGQDFDVWFLFPSHSVFGHTQNGHRTPRVDQKLSMYQIFVGPIGHDNVFNAILLASADA